MNPAAIVEQALAALANRDVDAFAACLHEDLVVEFPYAEHSGPYDRRFLLRTIRFLLDRFTTLRFETVRVHELVAPDRLVVEYASRFESDAGVGYANRYVGVFRFRDGLVSEWVEYANPVPFTAALAAIEAASRPSD